jgi:transcription elongation factor Elf1
LTKKKKKIWTCTNGHQFDKPIRKETKWQFWYICPICETRNISQIKIIIPQPQIPIILKSKTRIDFYKTTTKRGFETKPNGIKDNEIERIEKKNSTDWRNSKIECPRCGNTIVIPYESIGGKTKIIVCKICGLNL